MKDPASEPDAPLAVMTEPTFDATPHSMAVLDERGVVLRVNKAWREVMVSSNALSAGPGSDYLGVCDATTGPDADDARAVATGIRDVLAGRTPWFSHDYGCEIRAKGLHWFTVEGSALEGPGPERMVVSHIDITRAIAARQVIEERDSILAVLLEAITDVAVYMLDPEGRIRTWNAGAERLTGWTRDEVVGTSRARFFDPDERHVDAAAQHLAHAASTGKSEGEGWRVRKDGTRIIVAFSLYAVRDRRGRLTGFAKVMRDVTQQRAAEDEVRRALVVVEQRNFEMEQFAYTVSHDLKTPLVTVAGFAGHAKADLAAGRTDRLPQFLDRVLAGTARMKLTIDDLLVLSRLGRVGQPNIRVELALLVADIVVGMSEQIAAAGARVVVEPDIPDVTGDPARIRDAIENLIDNALAYGCPKPGMCIEIAASGDDEMVRLSVRDFGPGVPAESRERVFALFQRLHVDREGSGVGLAIVRRIAEAAGGRAWVEDAPGGGAVFFVSFPRCPDADVPTRRQPQKVCHERTTGSLPSG